VWREKEREMLCRAVFYNFLHCIASGLEGNVGVGVESLVNLSTI